MTDDQSSGASPRPVRPAAIAAASRLARLALTAALAACGSGGNGSGRLQLASSPAALRAAGPITVTDDAGKPVTLARRRHAS